MEFYPKFVPEMIAQAAVQPDMTKIVRINVSSGENTFVINTTAQEVLDYCSGENSLRNIYIMFGKNHPSLSVSQVKKDVDTILRKFTILYLVIWRNNMTPFLTSSNNFHYYQWQNYRFRKFTDTDLKSVATFLRKYGLPYTCRKEIVAPDSSFIYMSPTQSSSMYEMVSIRARLFQYLSILYLFTNENYELQGLIELQGNRTLRGAFSPSVAEIKLILFDNPDFLRVLPAFFERAIQDIPHSLVPSQFHKLRCRILTDLTSTEASQCLFLKELVHANFKVECTLLQEYGKFSEIFYTKLLSE